MVVIDKITNFDFGDVAIDGLCVAAFVHSWMIAAVVPLAGIAVKLYKNPLMKNYFVFFHLYFSFATMLLILAITVACVLQMTNVRAPPSPPPPPAAPPSNVSTAIYRFLSDTDSTNATLSDPNATLSDFLDTQFHFVKNGDSLVLIDYSFATLVMAVVSTAFTVINTIQPYTGIDSHAYLKLDARGLTGKLRS